MKRWKRTLKSFADSITYLPITLLAFLLLNLASMEGVLMQENIPSFSMQVFLFVSVLSLLIIPLNSILITNEVELICKKEFIEYFRTLGAGTWRIITKHIRPFLVSHFLIVFLREFIQTLILRAHLGILGIFIGGTVFKKKLFDGSTAVSCSGDWE